MFFGISPDKKHCNWFSLLGFQTAYLISENGAQFLNSSSCPLLYFQNESPSPLFHIFKISNLKSPQITNVIFQFSKWPSHISRAQNWPPIFSRAQTSHGRFSPPSLPLNFFQRFPFSSKNMTFVKYFTWNSQSNNSCNISAKLRVKKAILIVFVVCH